jgi:DNA modification methylase
MSQQLKIEPKYVDISVKRWENYTGLKAERIEQ